MKTLAISAALLGSTLGASLATAQTIDVWSRESDDSIQTLRAVVAAFTEETGIEVDLYYAMTDFEQRVARAAAGRDLPDVVLNDATYLGQWREMNLLEPIDRKAIEGGDSVLESAWTSALAPDGEYYAVPVSAQAFSVFIRKDWREALGMEQPKTWDEIRALAEAFTTQDPDGNGNDDTFGFTVPASATRGYTTWFLSHFIWQAGGDFVSEENGEFSPALASEGTAAGVEYIRSMICDGFAQPGAINATTADATPSFRSGQTGIYLSGPYHIALFDQEPGRDLIEVVAPPAGPEGVASLAEGTSAFMMRGSEEPAAAQRFIEFLISPRGQELAMGVEIDSVPIVRLPVIEGLSAEEVHDDPRWGTFAETFESNSQYFPSVPNWTPLRSLTAEGFNRALADCQSDIPQILAEIDEEMAKELEDQGALAE